MADHIGADLPLLLTGEADRASVDHAAAHLRRCEDCRQDLVSVVVAHASLESAHRFAAELVPDPRLLAAATPAGARATGTSRPDLSSMFDSLRSEERPAQRSRRGPLLVAAAAVTALVLGGGAYLVVANNNGSAPQASGGNHVTLSAFGVGRTSATATVSPSGAVSIDAATLPKLTGSHYEVWLTNGARTQLQPIGWINADGEAQLQVPADFVHKYSAIEVSVQRTGAPDYSYSGTSVLRGAFS